MINEQAIAISKAIDAAIVAEDGDGYRTHLGASVIGNECQRYLFYHFRWMHRETRSARMIRLHNVGHGFETRVRHWLVKLGFQFLDSVDVDGTQVRFGALHGHFGGSADGVFIAPQWGFPKPTLLECKTTGTGAPFNDLHNKEFKECKEQHFIQGSLYGKAFGLKQMLYVCENKNDSDWAIVVVNLDWKLAELNHRKAEFVILSNTVPARAFKKRNFFKCNMCNCQTVCWDGEPADVNCRSCQHATPGDNASWFCGQWQSTIPNEAAILKGCSQHLPFENQ